MKLDKTLTFQRQLKSLRQKPTSYIGLLRQVARLSLGAATKTLRTATMALVQSLLIIVPLPGVTANTLIENSINSEQRRPTVTGIPQLLKRIVYLYWQA